MKPEEFTQPTIENATPENPARLPETTVQPEVRPLGNDALSDAVRKSMQVRPETTARQEAEMPAPKFALDYVLNGESITETHIDEAHAVASYNRLRGLGIHAQPRTL